ncbi:hypothetical protein OCT63_18325 [Vibrio sp. RW]|uniref:hypothetical protein n=1 Tax=Vibrio sp. RW TaxID=2998833 RepID=UPI0022CD38EB|nr:hypothetical protein [Vibrio sp. RW]MDA0146186.1 hypothetical protein [Vibrio sp. RW]
MELANYNQLASSLFGSPELDNVNISYLENRMANMELVTRRGLSVNAILNKSAFSQRKHHITDSEARVIEAELKVHEGWLDDNHHIEPRRTLRDIRQTNLSKLILDPKYRDKANQFLKDILSTQQPSQALYFLLYEVSFEDQSFYFRAIEEQLDLTTCFLDNENI